MFGGPVVHNHNASLKQQKCQKSHKTQPNPEHSGIVSTQWSLQEVMDNLESFIGLNYF